MFAASAQPRVCSVCNVREFFPKNSMHRVCSQRCATKLAKAAETARKLAQKVEKAQDRAKRQSLETLPKLKKAAQVSVNKYVRLRDLSMGRGCISCGRKPEQCFGGSVDAGHFRSVGAAPHLRYYLPQIALQCVHCNRSLSGNVVEFRKGLVARHGLQRVEEIECMQGSPKWSKDYLRRLKTVFAKKARRLEKRNAHGSKAGY